MKISKLSIILAILVMPLVISCSDGGDAFDPSRNETPDPNEQEYTYTQEHITDLSCDANNECPEELSCWGLEGMGGALCVDPDPEEWFCEEETVPVVFSSYPPSLICDEEEELPPEEGPIDEVELCDAETACSEGLQCWVLPDDDVQGAQCVEPNPQDWYCGEGYEAIVGSSYPPVLGCHETEPEEVPADNITETVCTSDADCLAVDQTCWKIPDLGARCVVGNPMDWYCTEEGFFGLKIMGSPPEIRCFTFIFD